MGIRGQESVHQPSRHISRDASNRQSPPQTTPSYEDDSQTRIIVLANGPRMLREMLHQVLAAADGEQLVVEIEDADRIPAILRRIRVDWLVVSLPLLLEPPAALRQALASNPSLSILGISRDGAHVQVRKPGPVGDADREHQDVAGELPGEEFTLVEAALPDLLAVLGVNERSVSRSAAY